MKKSFFGWVAAALLAMACGGDDSSDGGGSSSCASNPQSCPATQTCWPIDANGKFSCVDAPTDKTAGTACTTIVGQAQCAPAHFCFPASSGSASGVCTPFCNQGACEGGAACVQLKLVNAPSSPIVNVCQPTGSGGTGGTAGAGGSTGGTAGSSSGGTGGSAGSSTGGTAGSASGGAAGSTGGAPSDAGSD